MHRRTLIIAEAGVNHNGDRARALAAGGSGRPGRGRRRQVSVVSRRQAGDRGRCQGELSAGDHRQRAVTARNAARARTQRGRRGEYRRGLRRRRHRLHVDPVRYRQRDASGPANRRLDAEGWLGRSHQRAAAAASGALSTADHPVDRHGDAGGSRAGARRHRLRLSRATRTRGRRRPTLQTCCSTARPGPSCAPG